MIVKIDDMRPVGVCKRARFWFAANGLNWRNFVRNGIEADKLLAVGTKQEEVKRVIEAARVRHGQK